MINAWLKISQAVLFVALFNICYSHRVDNISDASKFLNNYGYLNLRPNHLMEEKAFTSALKDYQKFMGIPPTGTLCNATLQMMNMPRCGVPDIKSNNKSSNFVVQRPWETKRLTYQIKNYPANLNRQEVDYTIQAAFDIWSKYTDLTFTRVQGGRVNIGITFSGIDGPSGVLAYAYFPPGGNANFDSYEEWNINGYSGYNLLQVAAHEFGHSLGLDHSRVYSALMWPSYKTGPSVDLDQDDVNGIQYLYGRKTAQKPTTTRRPLPTRSTTTTTQRPEDPEELTTRRPNNAPDLCAKSSIDAAFNKNYDTFVFKGDYYWKIVNYRIVEGYPQLIKQKWKELSGNLDAALVGNDKALYFFKNNLCWKYVNDKLSKGYPKLINEEFTGIPSNLDAAMTWRNGYMYFFKDNMFWKYSTLTKKANAFHINNLRGIPEKIDAAMKHKNGYTYFFKNGEFYRFNELTFSVDYNYPPYPRPTGIWWFGCDEDNSLSNEIETFYNNYDHHHHHHHHDDNFFKFF